MNEGAILLTFGLLLGVCSRQCDRSGSQEFRYHQPQYLLMPWKLLSCPEFLV